MGSVIGRLFSFVIVIVTEKGRDECYSLLYDTLISLFEVVTIRMKKLSESIRRCFVLEELDVIIKCLHGTKDVVVMYVYKYSVITE